MRRPYFSGFLGSFVFAGASLALSFTSSGCGGSKQSATSPSEISAQPAATTEPDLVAVVVGTVGRDHLTKDGYPLTKLADIVQAFKPDMIMIQIRADAYKKQTLEDASFEMTYVNTIAGTSGVDVQPIDWFKDEDSYPPGVMDDQAPASPKKPKKGGKPDATDNSSGTGDSKKSAVADPYNYMPPVIVDPDNADAFKSETSMLSTLGPMTFADANNDEGTAKIWDAVSAQIRYTKGYSPLARRIAWLGYNATEVFNKQKGQTHRLMVVVNVRYRTAMEQVVASYGAVIRDPVAIAKSADEAHDSIPEEVITQWHREVDRLKDKIPKHGPDTLRANMLQKIAILQAAIDKKGTCCVDASAMAPKDSDAK